MSYYQQGQHTIQSVWSSSEDTQIIRILENVYLLCTYDRCKILLL